MPRPGVKRTKLNHPTPSKRVANASQVSPAVELQQKLVNKPIGRVLTDSDDSDSDDGSETESEFDGRPAQKKQKTDNSQQSRKGESPTICKMNKQI